MDAETNDMRTKTIYTRWMAYELRKLGHNPVTIQPNPHKPEFDVWVFQDTKRLEENMTKITKDANMDCVDNIVVTTR